MACAAPVAASASAAFVQLAVPSAGDAVAESAGELWAAALLLLLEEVLGEDGEPDEEHPGRLAVARATIANTTLNRLVGRFINRSPW
jgi:hypothetical protein